MRSGGGSPWKQATSMHMTAVRPLPDTACNLTTSLRVAGCATMTAAGISADRRTKESGASSAAAAARVALS